MYLKKLTVSNIISVIFNSTEMRFQEKMVILIYTICKYNNIVFEAIQSSNGDAKNDGWIPSKKIFFAMYSPSDRVLSQLKQINKKLESDLDGLCDHVYNKGNWGGEIKKFFLIVNTHDKELPADPNGERNQIIADIKKKYDKDFEAKVITSREIIDYLLECDENLLDKLKTSLDVYNVEYSISISEIHDFMEEYVSYLANQDFNKTISTDFNRIDIEDKINLNDLQNIGIENKLNSAEKVEKFLKTMNVEGWDNNNWLKTKNYIINKCNELCKLYNGESLYNRLLDELLCDKKLIGSKSVILEAIVINIFIKCDIFSKE